MTPLQKKNINILLPLISAALYMWKFDKDFSNYKKSVPVAIGIFIVVLIITNQVTSYIIKEENKPDNGTIPANADNFDEGTFCSKLYEDITCYVCWRDKGLYKEFAGLPDAFVIAINKYWNDNYFGKVGESLRVAINGEVLGWELASTLKTINNRFDNLNIQ